MKDAMNKASDQTVRAEGAAARSGSGSRFIKLRAVVDRSRDNTRSTVALLRRRASRNAGPLPSIEWGMPLLLVVTLTVICFLALDEPAGAFHGQWAGTVGRLAIKMTDIGLGIWYVVPAVLGLVVVNQIDWKRFAGERLLLLYNWTTLAAFVLVSVGGALLLSNIVKRIIGRARPTHFQDHGVLAFDPFAWDASWASFPSGHSATVGGVVGVLVLLLPWSRWIVLPVGMWLVTTRVIVGAHYPSDVVAGFAFGFACAVIAAIAFARFGYLFSRSGSGWPLVKRSFLLLPRQKKERP